MRAVVAIAAVTIAVLGATPASAAPEDVANDISMHVMSPFCPGVTLHDCPTENASELRTRIVEMVEDGFTRAEILAFIEDEYGVSTRATPDASGAGVVAWILPGLALVAGAALAWRYARRWARVPAGSGGHDPDINITDEDRRRLDAELRRVRGEA